MFYRIIQALFCHEKSMHQYVLLGLPPVNPPKKSEASPPPHTHAHRFGGWSIQVITITSWRVSEDTLVQNRQGQEGGVDRGGNTGPVYFNNNSQTQGLSSQTLNETLGLWWSDKTQMLKRGSAKTAPWPSLCFITEGSKWNRTQYTVLFTFFL